MKLTIYPRLLLALVIFSLLLSACAVTSRNALIGKWKSEDQPTTYEFTSDGRLRMSIDGAQDNIQEIKFRFLSDTQIEFIAPGSTGQNQSIPFIINGNQLTLNLIDSSTNQIQPFVLTRVK